MFTNYLITATEVKNICPAINNEIDTTLINNAILLMQDTILKNSLTLDMWEDIMVNSGETNNKLLIDNYIKNLLSYSVWQYLAMILSYQLNSAGVRLKVSDHSTLAEAADIQYYRSYIQNFIDNTRRLMQEYIDDHPSDYPLYFIYENGKKPNVNNFKIGRVGGGDEYICEYWKGT